MAAAKELDERTYTLLVEVLGERHPDTLAGGTNLAISLAALGDAASAESLRGYVLRQLIATLGERHPNCRSVREGIRLNCDIEQPLI